MGNIKISYLGPEDSYSHVATLQILDKAEAKAIPCQTITNVFKASTPYAVVPISNTIQGVVQETLLNLVVPGTHETAEGGIGSEANLKWEIVGSHTLPVQHNLVVRQGVRLDDVEWVGSHEQALGQCSKYLDEHCPRARRIPFPSTAQAAILLASRASSSSSSSKPERPKPTAIASAGRGEEVVTDDNDERLRGEGAAICSSALMERLEGSLEVVAESVQNVKENYTRFLLLRHRDRSTSSPDLSQSTGKSTFLVTASTSSIHILPEQNRVLALHTHEGSAPASRKKFGLATSGSQGGPKYLVEVEGSVGPAPEGEWVVLGST